MTPHARPMASGRQPDPLVAIVALILIAAAASRRVVRRSIATDGSAFEADRAAGTAISLRRPLMIEILFAAVVLAVTAALVEAPPGREAAAVAAVRAPTPFYSRVVADDVVFQIELQPAAVGRNSFHLTLLDKQGLGTPALEMSASITPADGDVPPIDVPLTKINDSHYSADDLLIPTAGTWRIDVKALVTDTDERTATASVDIP